MSVTNFRDPVAEMQVAIQADVKEVGRVSELPAFGEGAIQITGNAHYDASAFSFHGSMSGAGHRLSFARFYFAAYFCAVDC